MVKVSVIIANHRADELFFATVDSVLKSEMKNAELIVVNNGLKEKESRLIREKLNGQAVKVIEIKQGNPSRARNEGVKVAKGKYLVFLDNDVEVEKNWLKNLVGYLEQNPQIGAGQLKLLRLDRKRVFDSAGDKLVGNGFLAERAQEAVDQGQFDEVDEIFSGKGAAMVVRREIFEEIGGFDEDYVYYWEEPDLLWRVWKTGKKVVFLWMSKVWHAYGSEDKKVSEEMYTHYNTIIYRMQRIKEITELDLDDPNQRLNIQIALKILNILNVD